MGQPVLLNSARRSSSGHAVGILELDCLLSFIPGDVDNASTYKYPVIYRMVPDLSTAACLSGAPQFASAVVDGAVALEAEGVRVISSDCGFMLQFQDAVRQRVGVPAAMSSMLQLAVISQMIAPDRPIGVLTADSSNLTPEFIASAGLKIPNPLIIRGMQDYPEFKTAIFDEKGSLDSDLICQEVIMEAKSIMAERPDTGALLLECSMMPPYARALQDAVGIPVFDFISLIDLMEAATRPPKAFA